MTGTMTPPIPTTWPRPKVKKAAQRLAKEHGIHFSGDLSGDCAGRNDYRITPSNQLVMDWLNGKGQTYPGGLNLVDVRDVAAAHVAALTRGENGHRYIVGGEIWK